ncbi:MAG: tetratricopeptide repeat protein [Nitrospirae bacterium]|nr:MAG: tetratricopeptide repeat protein [Nitrospirota bacterium]
MGKIAILVFLIFLGVLGFFAVENKDIVTLKVPFGDVYEIPKIALILLSSTLGALAILLVFFVRDTKRVIDNMQYSKRQKREEKVREYYSKALNAILGDKEEDAIGSLNDILKEDPEHLDALLRLGDIAMSNGDYRTAQEHYKKAYSINPKGLQALLSLESLMEKMDRHEDALRYIDDILDIDSENLTALYRKRRLLEKREQWDALLSLQKSILKLEHNENDKNREEKKLRGYTYEYGRASLENGEMEKAEKAFRHVIKMDEGFVPAYLGVAEVLHNKGETEDAINFLEKIFEQLNSVIILARLEDLLISVGEPGRLIRFYKSAISKKPNDAGLKFLLGKLFFRLEMVEDALNTLNEIDTSLLSTTEFYNLRGELYLKRNQIPKAIEDFRKACEFKKTLIIPYCCSSCGFHSVDWTGRCPKCLNWNTYKLDIYNTCKLK